ncbi:MAG: beta-galactosidase [Verrucomicrobia bacterium]|nr:beta-galactosidase [Verrucomicrobiota bacterium]
MKHKLLRALGALAFPCLVSVMSSAQSAPAHYTFPPADLMRIGAYYYPEAWPEAQWRRDMAYMKILGMEFVHMGEFAWAFLEPTEGNFDFAWLDKNIALAAEQGLKVVLCTPTPTPPIWLTQKYPDTLMVDAAGRRQAHGTRQHACWNSDAYLVRVTKIVNELGRRYGKDARVWGWQLDNELTHYGKEPCFCDHCQREFQAWLEKKYQTIAALNRDWGNSFWSQMYQRFDQIRLPNPAEYPAQFNPHHMLDSQRWFAEDIADYMRFQTGILRKYCGHNQWITTNHIHNFPSVNPALTARDFDIVTWTLYPVHGNANEGPLGYRLGSSATLTFAADFMRSLNGQAGIMELQPGQVNWGEVNPQPYPGAVRLWIMRAFAAGQKFVCTYRYRQPLSGAELYHYGLVGPDGVTPTTGGEQYSQAAREIARLRAVAQPGAPLPEKLAARRAAILYSYDNRWDLDNHKQNKAWDTYGHLLKYHSALKRAGAPVDVITEDKDFSAYKILVAPAYQLLDDKLVARWKTFVEAGGHLILSCRTGHKDRRGFLWEGPWAKPILDLIGARIKFYDTLPAPHTGKVKTNDGAEHTWNTWAEVLESDNTAITARYADHYYAGGFAANWRTLGKGTVTYIGVDTQDGTLEAQLVREVVGRTGDRTAESFPEGFCVDFRDGLWIATNYTEKTVTAPIPSGAKLILGTRDVPIAGVTVWQE